MPSSHKPTTMGHNQPQLDLIAWSKFKPQERANDFEYNLLLYKFKTFFNEVRDFHQLHTNCSVTRSFASTSSASATSTTTGEQPIVNNSTSTPVSIINNNRFISPLSQQQQTTTTTTGNSIDNKPSSNVSEKRSFFKHQNSMPATITNANSPLVSPGNETQLVKQMSFHNSPPNDNQVRVGSINNNQHQYNYNMQQHSIASSMNTVGLATRPEIKRRTPLSNSIKCLLSKSSERLDAVNNNIQQMSSSLKDKHLQLSNQQSLNNQATGVAINDSNIYDAVSPDDEIHRISVASSIHNLNRLSMPQRTRLESSKSSLAIGSSGDASNNPVNLNKNNNLPYNPVGMNSLSLRKSIPLRENNDSQTIEHSNNSFGSSSIMLDATNSSSSLSFTTAHNNFSKMSDEYADYVNIDFFLRRNKSPSFEGLDGRCNATNERGTCDSNDDSEEDGEEDDDDNQYDVEDDYDEDDDDDDTTSEQISDDILKNMSPREIARKLSTTNQNRETITANNNTSSTTSITPASSGDFLEDSRLALASKSSINKPQTSGHTISKQIPDNIKYNSFSPPSNHTEQNDNHRFKSLSHTTSPKDAKFFPSQHPLGAIEEDKTSYPLEQQFAGNNSSFGEASEQLDKNGNAFVEAHNTMKTFLSDLNLSSADDDFEDKAQRRIVKESFAVEFCGRRKLRHLFLFNDVIVCAKYQASSKQKFTFDVRWYLNLTGISILDMSDPSNQVKYDKEVIENQILAIRTNLMLLRTQMQQMKRSKRKPSAKVIKKLKKKRTELEAELVLLLPHLPLVIKHINGKKYTFFLSSNFDRNQWIESIKFLQSRLPSTKGSAQTTPSSSELQAWIQTCRKNLNPSLGTFLLRSNCDDDLLYGDLYLRLANLNGLTKQGQYYFCFEVDSYGHFSQKASSAMLKVEQKEHEINEDFVFPLDGTHTLRILLYEEQSHNAKPSVIGKTHIELSKSWLMDKAPVEKVVTFSTNCSLTTLLSYSNFELLSMRFPNTKLCPTFGLDISQVCKKEKTNVPMVIQLCVNEVERRGMREVGIYRMSGTFTDVQRLKKAFETNPYVAELLLRDIDINSVTGFLKTYLRELPEGLFSNKLYPRFVAAFNTPQSKDSLDRTKKMLDLFHKIPIANQHTIIYLVEHLVKIYKFESYNKMSLTNLATVLGPNILRSPTETNDPTNSVDPFTAVVIGSMSQAGILYFFLDRKYSNLPLTELDSSEIAREAQREADEKA